MESKEKKSDTVEEKKENKEKKEEKEAYLKPPDPYADVQKVIALFVKGIKTKERQYFGRGLRRFNTIRKNLTLKILEKIVDEYYPEARQWLRHYEPLESMVDVGEEEEKKTKEQKSADPETTDVDMTDESKKEEMAAKKEIERKKKEEEEKVREEIRALPEVRIYVHLLITVALMDNNQKQVACDTAKDLFKELQTHNRRTLDLLSAKVYFYYSLTHENNGYLASIRSDLIRAHRSDCLRRNECGQAALTVCILRNYIAYKLYNQADNFTRFSTFPRKNVGNNMHARYLYYMGQIKSIQLKYSEAYTNLMQAIRKAPHNSAVGFRQKAHKLAIIVQLLMGEIPERKIFMQKKLKLSLKPYYELTQAVRAGNLSSFEQVVQTHQNQFKADGIYSLIVRIRHNVIKTGLRRINLSYSRISIKDICQKLDIKNEEDAEHIVAKAISDRVIDAVIDRNDHYLFSKEADPLYTTPQPATAFHKRIQFCLDIHNESVKAMRYPPNAHKPQSEKEKEEKEKEEKKKEEKDKKDKEKKDKDKDKKKSSGDTGDKKEN